MAEAKLVTNSLKQEFLSKLQKRFFIVLDENVERIYRPFLEKEFYQFSTFWIVVPPGEKMKTREMKLEIEDKLFSQGIRPDDLLIAIGGGVITDLVGFIASTLYRGIPYINIPTTLLGMVDASIGGKTGVNTPFGKNSIGSFHLPLYIYREPFFLETLPQEELLMGIAEIIKYGLILDRELFEELERKKEIDQEVIERSAKLKELVVSIDFRESGYRQILNFGHTIAHSLELLTSYEIPHGFAVAIGLLIESHISYQEGYFSYQDVERVFALLKSYDFPLERFDRERFYQKAFHDKKNRNQEIHFVLIKGIGLCVEKEGKYSFPISKEKIDKAFDWYEALWNTV